MAGRAFGAFRMPRNRMAFRVRYQADVPHPRRAQRAAACPKLTGSIILTETHLS
jgi:hypothetical protein